ncbi:hypothetical protein [Brevibacterium sp. Mu109]|uniref:hypothetical protein n=1 Tax=Brevibacterium sp. Mu109 TaxID=1255669 RepID=UPI0015E0C682|nr:hypothetical protein [Brevibacterium sp. Mu109]
MQIAQESFVDGWQNAMWVGAAVMGVLFIYVLARGPQRTTPPAEDSADTGTDARQ